MTDILVEETQTYAKVPRAELVAALRERDGDKCQHPDCRSMIDFDVTDGPLEPTIDHWVPQWVIRDVPEGMEDPWESGKIPEWVGRREDWDRDRIWDLPNLKMMHKKCNAKKGDLIPNEDGTLPRKPKSTFRFRRQKRAGRPDLCMECNNGHDLFIGEYCASCGCDAQRFPRSAKVRYDECDHELSWCWVCSITPDMRPATVGIAMRHADSDELGEYLEEEDVD